VAEDFIKTLPLILEINGGFTKVIHLLLLLAVLGAPGPSAVLQGGCSRSKISGVECSTPPSQLYDPSSPPREVDSSLAASAWQKYYRALVKKQKGTMLATLMAKKSYRYGQAAPADPPQTNFFPPAPSPVS
jgi:hypothetical protein